MGELCLPVFNRGAASPRRVESVVFFSLVISQNPFKTSTMVGLVVLFSFQHSLRRSHTTPVIPILSAFSGFRGRSPKATACVTSASLIGKNGHLPVNTWYTVIPKAYMSASFDGTPFFRPKSVGKRSSGAVKDAVPCSLLDISTGVVVMRVEPKSASIARGGAESEMRMFG